MDAEHLKLTDFMDLAALQEIQDHFAAVAHVRATITDADGPVLTQAQPAAAFVRRQRDIAAAADAADAGAAVGYAREGAEYVAPIVVNDQRLGTLRMAVKRRPGRGWTTPRSTPWRPSSGWSPSPSASWPRSWPRPATAGRRPSPSCTCWPTPSPGCATRSSSSASGSRS